MARGPLAYVIPALATIVALVLALSFGIFFLALIGILAVAYGVWSLLGGRPPMGFVRRSTTVRERTRMQDGEVIEAEYEVVEDSADEDEKR